MTNIEWDESFDIFDMAVHLVDSGRFSDRLWRRFHCHCCRDIWEYIYDSRSRQAIVIAEQYIDCKATLHDLQLAHVAAIAATDDAWNKVQALVLNLHANTAVWPVSRESDLAWVTYCAAAAAKEATAAKMEYTAIPDSAACVRAWSSACETAIGNRPDAPKESDRDAINIAWKDINLKEQIKQADLLRRIVASSDTTG